MCLHIYNVPAVSLKAKTAERDIKCYKVVYEDERKRYLSPWRDVEYPVGGLVKADGFEAECPTWEDPVSHRHVTEVSRGLHTFKGVERACETLDGLQSVVGGYVQKGCVLECTIPKGTRYYEGSFDGCVSYASETLRVDGVLKTVDLSLNID